MKERKRKFQSQRPQGDRREKKYQHGKKRNRRSYEDILDSDSESADTQDPDLRLAIELSLLEGNQVHSSSQGSKSYQESYNYMSRSSNLNAREEIIIPNESIQLFQDLTNSLERQYGVLLQSIEPNKYTICGEVSEIVSVAKFSLEELVTDRLRLDVLKTTLQNEKVHIFIDSSNIGLHVTPKGVDALVAGARTVYERVIFGSTIKIHPNKFCKKTEQVWKVWESLHYKVAVSVRDRTYRKEEFVDDALIAQINASILNYPSLPPHPPHTLVLLTGDGNENYGRASFFQSVNQALVAGWKVELWTWKRSCSSKYVELKEAYSGANLFEIYYLDDFKLMVFRKDPLITSSTQIISMRSNLESRKESSSFASTSKQRVERKETYYFDSFSDAEDERNVKSRKKVPPSQSIQANLVEPVVIDLDTPTEVEVKSSTRGSSGMATIYKEKEMVDRGVEIQWTIDRDPSPNKAV